MASTQQYYRSESSESATTMLRVGDREESSSGTGEKNRPRRECNPMLLAVAVTFILALQVACTTGLFVYFSMSISKLKAQTQGTSEELRCLQIINSMGDMSDPVESDLDGLILNESCQKLTSSIKSYVTQVTENIISMTAAREASRSIMNRSETVSLRGNNIKSSAHLTLHRSATNGEVRLGNENFGTPSQSCRFPITNWDFENPLSHKQNMSYQNGKLKIQQDGKYYVYSQIYFRFLKNKAESAPPTSGHQLVQCMNKKTSYINPILLLKGVGTKCWAPNAEYGLHSVHLGGVFELRTGDELFVSVSSLDMIHTDGTASYFGAFRLDM
ncbi:tumor necrosis factor ligand superfamily member 10 [Bombina bombina]|uniref:tumor necrosis factor ligand superfamily member 10 n=1 Tax=Bombina bombina TaxID=8345 RepID=UPI00235AA60A|nr:tumor necrosis factor ligand superfamily member 10 [Bombina bombina]